MSVNVKKKLYHIRMSSYQNRLIVIQYLHQYDKCQMHYLAPLVSESGTQLICNRDFILWTIIISLKGH